MKGAFLSVVASLMCSLISVGIAARMDTDGDVKATARSRSTVNSTGSDWWLSTAERLTRWESKVCVTRHGSGGVVQHESVIYSRSFMKHTWQIEDMIKKGTKYAGRYEPSPTTAIMRSRFWNNLVTEVNARVTRAHEGGVIDEFGKMSTTDQHSCTHKPTLSLSQVQDLARKAFNNPHLVVSQPPCSGTGVSVPCSFTSGQCCKRAQTEFVGRYYDTAVAAMALGATRDEAFATLLHARALAFSLQACDPKDHHKGYSSLNDVKFTVLDSWGNVRTGIISTKDIHVISFPVAYEVLYEIYNTMLIERMRSRRTVSIPTHGQMRTLHDAVYYKKLIVRICTLDRDIDPDLLFPNASDMSAAGLVMYNSNLPSSRMVDLNEESKAKDYSVFGGKSDSKTVPDVDSLLHPSLRYHDAQLWIYEYYSHHWQLLTYPSCNERIPDEPYYPYVYETYTWSKYQGCCAKECHFMALYGGTFSSQSVNCCSGCNRYSCKANDESVANMLATIGAIEVPPKSSGDAQEMTFTV